jgi:hypothetical protein
MPTRQELRDRLPSFMDFQADEREVAFAQKVLVPGVAAVAATAIGFGIARACCGVNYRRVDPKGILPIGMAVATAGVAAWSYLNPQAFRGLD